MAKKPFLKLRRLYEDQGLLLKELSELSDIPLDTLKGRLLNTDVVDRESASPAALASAIEANRESPNLFRDLWEFTKEKPPADPNAPPKRPPMPAAWR